MSYPNSSIGMASAQIRKSPVHEINDHLQSISDRIQQQIYRTQEAADALFGSNPEANTKDSTEPYTTSQWLDRIRVQLSELENQTSRLS